MMKSILLTYQSLLENQEQDSECCWRAKPEKDLEGDTQLVVLPQMSSPANLFHLRIQCCPLHWPVLLNSMISSHQLIQPKESILCLQPVDQRYCSQTHAWHLK